MFDKVIIHLGCRGITIYLISAVYVGLQGAAVFDVVGIKHISYGFSILFVALGTSALYCLPLAGINMLLTYWTKSYLIKVVFVLVADWDSP